MRSRQAELILAIARNTIAQAVRVRVAFVILAVYLVLVPALPFLVEGDGTLVGLLHVVITYSLILAGVLLGLLTLVVSTTSLWSEIRDKQIQLIESRPVRRWHVLVGKLLGILAVNAALLAFMAVVIVACVEVLATQGRWARSDRERAREQVLIGRRRIRPEPPDEQYVKRNVDRRYKELAEAGRLPEGRTEADIKRELRGNYLALMSSVLPRRGRRWLFRRVGSSRRPEGRITIRFKFASSDTLSDSPVWTKWHVGYPKVYRGARKFKADEFHEFSLPADALDEKGDLRVDFYNIAEGYPVLVFAGEEAIQALVPVCGFAANLARGLALIFTEVLFLAILGLFCSTCMTFPVSPILALTLLLIITLAGSLHSEFEKGLSLATSGRETEATDLMERVVQGITRVVRVVLPPLDRYAASPLVSNGRYVSWLLLAEAIGLVAIVRGGALLLVSICIFERRELAGAER